MQMAPFSCTTTETQKVKSLSVVYDHDYVLLFSFMITPDAERNYFHLFRHVVGTRHIPQNSRIACRQLYRWRQPRSLELDFSCSGESRRCQAQYQQRRIGTEKGDLSSVVWKSNKEEGRQRESTFACGCE